LKSEVEAGEAKKLGVSGGDPSIPIYFTIQTSLLSNFLSWLL
jgi:hypothetical protein